MRMSRRELGLAAVAGLVASGSVVAKPANVPVIWDGKMMWETFEKDATGFSYPHRAGSPKAYMTFDSQCPYCLRLLDQFRPILAEVNLIWCPVAVLNIHSEPQGATMLVAKNPSAVMDEHHDHFKDEAFRGIRYDQPKLPEDVRNKVWTNTKLHRRSGCRVVPFGVYKNPKGEYVALDHNLTTEELAKIFGVKYKA